MLLSLSELMGSLSVHEMETWNILMDLLPMHAEAGSRVESLVRGMLLNETDEPMDAETADRRFVGYADEKETKRLYEAVNRDWEKALPALGWHCLDALSPIATEKLLG